MKKKIISLILAVLFVATSAATLLVLPASADSWDGTSVAAAFSGGKGTEAEPYLIGSAAELAYLSASHTEIKAADESTPVYYKLTTDVNLQNNLWTPIGTSKTENPFKGVFDGDNHTISGFNVELPIEGSGSASAGLFGGADGAVIKNVRVIGTKCTGTYSGGILAYGVNGVKVLNCYTKIDHIDGLGVGAVVGRTESTINEAEIFGCVSDSNIEVKNYHTKKDVFAGGIVGVAGGCTVSYCTSNTNIAINHDDPDPESKKTHLIGGIIGCQGAINSPTFVRYCYSTGTIKGYTAAVAESYPAFAGGIVGRASHIPGGSVENCFTTAKIVWTATKDATQTTTEDKNHFGDIAGQVRYAVKFVDCYALSDHFIGTDDTSETDLTQFKALTENQMKGDEALKNMNLRVSAEKTLEDTIKSSLENANYYPEELTAMEKFTEGKSLLEYMTAFVAANYQMPASGEVWTTTPGELPTITNLEVAYKIGRISNDVSAMIEEELKVLDAKVKAAEETDDGSDNTTEGSNTTTNTPSDSGKVTTPSANDTKPNTPSTNTGSNDAGCAGCGGFTAVATLAALLVGSAAFVVIKKKF